MIIQKSGNDKKMTQGQSGRPACINAMIRGRPGSWWARPVILAPSERPMHSGSQFGSNSSKLELAQLAE